jgi:hypothetical protein
MINVFALMTTISKASKPRRILTSMKRVMTLRCVAVTAAIIACASKTDSTRVSGSTDTLRSQPVVASGDSAPVPMVASGDSAPVPVVTPGGSAQASQKPTVRLVDFVVPGIMEDPVGKIEVTTGRGVDTLPGLTTVFSPIVTDDGLIHGLAMTPARVGENGYDYDPLTKNLTVFPLPSEVNGFFHETELSSDAKYVAYVAHVQSGLTWAVVRSWPSLAVVAQTSPSEGYPSDVSFDEIKWQSPNRFHISYRISSGSSIVVEGDPRSGKIKVDTVSTPQN